MVLLKEIRYDTVVARSPGLVAADMDGEKVMLNIEKGKYFGLNGSGSRIWELLEKPLTVREMVAILMKEYEVEEETCQRDLLTFLSRLYAHGLVAFA